MGVFEQFPYANFHELNLDWLLKKMRELDKKLDDFIKINQIKYADPIDWNITNQYEANTVVVDPTTGIAYLSTQAVPSGVSITNTDYWTPIFDLAALFAMINNNLTDMIEVSGTTNATFESHKGDLILLNGILYVVIVDDITIGTQYVPNINILQTTVATETEVVYSYDDKKLTLHGKLSSGGEIISRGDYHVYSPDRQSIDIIEVS